MKAPAVGRWCVGAVMVILLAPAAAAQHPPDALPDAPGVEIARARCLTCHGADMIVGQRLSAAGWAREVDKMIRWGAAVTADEHTPLTAYLSRFGPAPAVSHSRAAEGEAVFTRACLGCHGRDMVAGQRLSHTGWTREVDKMIRWGAAVSDADKGALVDFLAASFPVQQ